MRTVCGLGLTMALAWALGAGCTRSEPPGGGPAKPSDGDEDGDAAPAAAPGDSEIAAGDAGAAPGDVDLTGLVHQPEADELAAAPVKLPAGWQGTGVLARRSDRLPRRAPSWAKVLVEVTLRDGQRYLVATGRVSKVKDVQLARSTAENRARAELARWTKTDKQTGGAIREVWRDARTGETFAQVELPVPTSWQPGTPLGEGT